MDLEEASAFATTAAAGPAIISIMSDREQVGLDALKEIADLVEVEPAELFAYGPF